MSFIDTSTVSVIIPTYNRQPFLQRAIDSVLRQSRKVNEIIIVDDGSKDGTAHFINNTYPQIQYIFQANKGISNARNRGIKAASGEWIAFLDSDDEWLPRKIENQLTALENEPHFQLCHCNEIWIRHGKRVNPGKRHEKSGGEIFRRCLPLCVISPSSVLIHQSVFKTYGDFDESLPVCEDYDLWLRICAFLPVLYLPEAQIIKYGGHQDQLSHKYWGIDRFRIKALEKIILTAGLSGDKKKAALTMLIEKIDIYLLGAVKRNKNEEVRHYSALKNKYLAVVN
jgi:glycosyltransferase involved in cell wall biosynthesis